MSEPQLKLGTKLSYGFGAVAYGVKNNGFDYFLLLFYSQVLGVDPALVGLALAIALAVDAVSDPLVGYMSDNLHSKWGRRHPFMYAAALPVAATYFLLWNPPQGMSEQGLFFYLVILSIIIRTLITLYETPSQALAPELTEEYDQRTRLLSFRYFFGWFGGNFMSILMFGALLTATADYPDGRLNPAAYGTYGIISAALIFIAIIGSAMGTHSRIPHLKAPPAKRKMTPKLIFGEIFQTLADKSTAALMLSTLFGAVATGVAASLAFYILTYFWELSGEQIFIWTSLVFVSAVLGTVIAPIASRTLGKKRGAIVLGIAAFGVAPFAVMGRLMGFMPDNGDPLLFPLLLVLNTLDIGLIIAVQILAASMIADLVEQSELRTKRRSEGIFFSAITLTRKSVQGLGVLIAGLILSAVDFPREVTAGEVPEETLFSLGLYYIIALYILWSLMLLMIYFYKIDREGHESNLRMLREDVQSTDPI